MEGLKNAIASSGIEPATFLAYSVVHQPDVIPRARTDATTNN
jgi:hypothetical protein